MRMGFFKKNFLISAFCSLLSALPLNATTPVDKLPGVVDADSWKRPRPTPPPPQPMPPQFGKVHELVLGLNQLPEEELNEKDGPAVALIADLRQEDGPEFIRLKTVLARADVRKALNPGTKGLLAGLISPRWDGFVLTGNLWLAALQSKNADYRLRARQHLPEFIQTAHVPILIHLLNTPGPNVLAYEILEEVTGQQLNPNQKTWQSWWNKTHGKVDVVGHVLNQSRQQLTQIQIRPVDLNQFWYLPAGISQADVPYAKRSVSQQNAIGRWSDWAGSDVRQYAEEWTTAKPSFDRMVHQPDPRVALFLKSLVSDPGFGDYASVVLAWRGDAGALKVIQDAYASLPTVGRALARGSMGDKRALQDLVQMIEAQKAPLTYDLMNETLRGFVPRLAQVGAIPAEQAFELLTHQRFGLTTAATAGEKRKIIKKARRWLEDRIHLLTLDKKHGYYVLPTEK